MPFGHSGPAAPGVTPPRAAELYVRPHVRRRAVLAASLLPMAASAAEYSVGDIWTFKARGNEPLAKVAIAHIERGTSEGDVYFIHVLDVKLRLKGPPAPVRAYGSVAVTKECLDSSVVKKINTGAAYPYQSGYASWKESVAKHKRGAFRGPLSDLLEHLERTVLISKW